MNNIKLIEIKIKIENNELIHKFTDTETNKIFETKTIINPEHTQHLKNQTRKIYQSNIKNTNKNKQINEKNTKGDVD